MTEEKMELRQYAGSGIRKLEFSPQGPPPVCRSHLYCVCHLLPFPWGNALLSSTEHFEEASRGCPSERPPHMTQARTLPREFWLWTKRKQCTALCSRIWSHQWPCSLPHGSSRTREGREGTDTSRAETRESDNPATVSSNSIIPRSRSSSAIPGVWAHEPLHPLHSWAYLWVPPFGNKGDWMDENAVHSSLGGSASERTVKSMVLLGM